MDRDKLETAIWDAFTKTAHHAKTGGYYVIDDEGDRDGQLMEVIRAIADRVESLISAQDLQEKLCRLAECEEEDYHWENCWRLQP